MRHPSFVDIADQAATRSALDINLLQHAILKQGRTHFARRHIHQDFFFQ